MGEQQYLAIETSGRTGLIGLGIDGRLMAERFLDERRRHARDLMPLCRDLLHETNWKLSGIAGVVVSLGPGSYTGLRVGVMAAKTMAYALGCRLIGVPTFEVIARQAETDQLQLDVIADALKDKLYVQRFIRDSNQEHWTPGTPLQILPNSSWLAGLNETIAVTGPGLALLGDRLPSSISVTPVAQRAAGLNALLALGHERSESIDLDAALSLEPIYLRPSSAEEQWSNLSHRA